MKKIFKTVVFSALLLSLLTASCNLVMLTPTPETTPTPVPSFAPTKIVSTATVGIPTASATPEFAPFCDANSASIQPMQQCQLPVAEESSTFCIKKDPYNLILIDKDMTYQVLTDGFKCTDGGIQDGKQLLTCTGQYSAYFALSVCDPACAVPTVEAAVTACPQGYNYNAFQGCCTQEAQQVAPNCQAYEFRTTSCVVRCFEFQKESKCKRNSWACTWNDKDKVCELRK